MEVTACIERRRVSYLFVVQFFQFYNTCMEVTACIEWLHVSFVFVIVQLFQFHLSVCKNKDMVCCNEINNIPVTRNIICESSFNAVHIV
jgi:hypothetical protein